MRSQEVSPQAVPEAPAAEQPDGPTIPEQAAEKAPAIDTITKIDLADTWKFSIDLLENGLDEGWHLPDYNDTAWRSLHVPVPWEKQGIAMENPRWPPDAPQCLYNGYAWYRRHVTIPAEWAHARVVLRMGQVWDVDWTYVNGELVGTTQGEHAWDTEREYLIPPDVLKPGEDNLIAVRVCDYRMEGGIAVGPVELVNASAIGLGQLEPYVEHRGDMVNVGGSVEVPADTRVNGNAVAVLGDVDVRGRVTGDAVTIGGRVHIFPEGRVDGEVVAIGGKLIRDPGSHVGRGVTQVGGFPGAIVERVVGLAVGADRRGLPFLWIPAFGALGLAWTFLKNLVVWGLFAVIAVLVMPKRLELMAQSLPTYPGRTAVYGLAGVALWAPALLVTVLAAVLVVVILAITVIGILLIPAVAIAVPALLFALVLAVLFGIASVWLGLGRAAMGRLGRPDAPAIWAILLGVALVALVSVIPPLGALVGLTLMFFGFGVALMTGLGTDPEWAHKRLGFGRGPAAPPAPTAPPPPGDRPAAAEPVAEGSSGVPVIEEVSSQTGTEDETAPEAPREQDRPDV
jgi:hypothetical protein